MARSEDGDGGKMHVVDVASSSEEGDDVTAIDDSVLTGDWKVTDECGGGFSNPLLKGIYANIRCIYDLVAEYILLDTPCENFDQYMDCQIKTFNRKTCSDGRMVLCSSLMHIYRGSIHTPSVAKHRVG